MYKKDLALNDLQGSICHKNKPNQTRPILRSRNIFMINKQNAEVFEMFHFYKW